MKIVHLSFQDSGGAGIAAYRLHKGLISLGIDSTMLVLTKNSGDNSVKVFKDPFNPNMDLFNIETYQSKYLQAKFEVWLNVNKYYPNCKNNLEIFSEVTSEIDLTEHPDFRDADIINLHWVTGMIDYTKFNVIFSGKKVVWTLHDMNPFTGGCHYSGDCDAYTKGCKSCPQLNSGNENDLSYLNFTIKHKALYSENITIVSPSEWLGNCASLSEIFGNKNIQIIPYGLPTNLFVPNIKENLKIELGIPLNSKIILFGAAYNAERKGFSYLIEALNIYAERDLAENTYLGVFGPLPENTILNKKYKLLNFGYVNSEELLSKIYSLADVYVIPSLEDNLPNTVLESLSCGTPVVGFKTGGIPDMVRHKLNGFIADNKNSVELADGIEWILNLETDYLKNVCRTIAEEKYSLETQAENYINLYKKLYDEN